MTMMTCEQIAKLMPDYMQGTLRSTDRMVMDEHIASCGECRDEIAVWQKLSLLPDEKPSPMLRERFDAMLGAYEQGRHQQGSFTPREIPKAPGFWGQFSMPQMALTMALVFVAFFAGRLLDRPTTTSTGDEMTAVKQEMATMRQLMVVNMLRQETATQRLQAVNYSMDIKKADPEIVSALVHAMRYDSSVDVRLAALESLRRYADHGEVRTGMRDSLNPSQNPMVQIALIDTLVELKDKNAVEKLEQIRESKDVNPSVRKRADEGIAKLRS